MTAKYLLSFAVFVLPYTGMGAEASSPVQPAPAPSSVAFPNPQPASDRIYPQVARLIEACRRIAPPFRQLKEELVNLQWGRLIGEIPMPRPLPPGTEEAKRLWLQRERPPHQLRPLTSGERSALETAFRERSGFKEKFMLALDPEHDNYPEAARIILNLGCYDELAIAYAVVWDDPALVRAASMLGIPELYSKPPTLPALKEAYRWQRKHLDETLSVHRMPWSLCTHLVCDGTPFIEREWAINTYGAFGGSDRYTALGAVYDGVEYDQGKISDHKGQLAGRDYTLANLKLAGGVCRDQAYYARAVCRAYGVPAYMATSNTNTGLGHAWVGWVAWDEKGNGYKVFEHGRYQEDKFYTADILDPQTGCFIKDFILAVRARGLSNSETYQEADVYYRVCKEVGMQIPATSRIALLKEALKRNPFHRQAWLAIGEAVASGEILMSEAARYWDFLQKTMSEYPDFTFSILNLFGQRFKAFQARMNFYEQAAGLFGREDLLARLRIEQVDVCCGQSQFGYAARVLDNAVKQFADEGPQSLALARRALTVFERLAKPGTAISILQEARARIQRDSRGFINPNWKEMTELLRDACVKDGRTPLAQALNKDLEQAEATLRTAKPVQVTLPVIP